MQSSDPRQQMDSFVNEIVLPGDVLLELNSSEELREKLILGPGLRRDCGRIIATKSGVVRNKDRIVYYVDNHQKRYVPVRGETVLGVVIKKGGEEVVVDIGSSEPATLPLLSFEGATKKNKPIIKVGDLVFAKILVACKEMEPELVCVNSYGKSAGLGILSDGGFVITVTLEYARKLLSPESPILKRLGKNLRFETAIGLNGRAWIQAANIEQTLLVVQAISALEYATTEEVTSMCDRIFETVTIS